MTWHIPRWESDIEALDYLDRRNVVANESHQLIPLPLNYRPKPKELSAIDYLCKKWNFSYRGSRQFEKRYPWKRLHPPKPPKCWRCDKRLRKDQTVKIPWPGRMGLLLHRKCWKIMIEAVFINDRRRPARVRGWNSFEGGDAKWHGELEQENERLKKFDVKFHEDYVNLQPVGKEYDLLEWQAKLQTELGMTKVRLQRLESQLTAERAEREKAERQLSVEREMRYRNVIAESERKG